MIPAGSILGLRSLTRAQLALLNPGAEPAIAYLSDPVTNLSQYSPSGEIALWDAVAGRWIRASDGLPVGTEREGPLVSREHLVLENHFMTASAQSAAPFTGAAISSGTIAAYNIANINGHPGVIRLSSSATANSGYRLNTDPAMIAIEGGEQFMACLQMPFPELTNTTVRMGFLDTINNLDATDGIYFESAGNTFSAKTSSLSSRTSQGAASIGATFHWFWIKVADDASSVNFRIFQDGGTQVFNETITTTIPVTSSRATGAGLVVTNSGTTAQVLIHIDWMRADLYPGVSKLNFV